MSNEKTLDMSRFPENLDVSQNYGDKYLELRSSVLELENSRPYAKDKRRRCEFEDIQNDVQNEGSSTMALQVMDFDEKSVGAVINIEGKVSELGEKLEEIASKMEEKLVSVSFENQTLKTKIKEVEKMYSADFNHIYEVMKWLLLPDAERIAIADSVGNKRRRLESGESLAIDFHGDEVTLAIDKMETQVQTVELRMSDATSRMLDTKKWSTEDFRSVGSAAGALRMGLQMMEMKRKAEKFRTIKRDLEEALGRMTNDNTFNAKRYESEKQLCKHYREEAVDLQKTVVGQGAMLSLLTNGEEQIAMAESVVVQVERKLDDALEYTDNLVRKYEKVRKEKAAPMGYRATMAKMKDDVTYATNDASDWKRNYHILRHILEAKDPLILQQYGLAVAGSSSDSMSIVLPPVVQVPVDVAKLQDEITGLQKGIQTANLRRDVAESKISQYEDIMLNHGITHAQMGSALDCVVEADKLMVKGGARNGVV